jgi:large subunit ribosomal protein L21
MYGIVEIKGNQYKVETGMVLDVQKIDQEVGETVTFDQVLFIGGDNKSLGQPYIKGAQVVAQIVKQDRSRKKVVFRRLAGKYQKKNGHRQSFTSVLIKEINDGSGQTTTIDATSKNGKKFLK